MALSQSMGRSVFPTVTASVGTPFSTFALNFIGKKVGAEFKSLKDLDSFCQKADSVGLMAVKEADVELEYILKDIGATEAVSGDSKGMCSIGEDDRETPRYLAYLCLLFFFVCSFVLILMAGYAMFVPEAGEIPAWIIGLVGAAYGAVSMNSKQVLEFYFGASNGASMRDRLLFNSSPIVGGSSSTKDKGGQ